MLPLVLAVIFYQSKPAPPDISSSCGRHKWDAFCTATDIQEKEKGKENEMPKL